jgi:hypothetical protein
MIGMMMCDQYVGELQIIALQIFDYRLCIARVDNADSSAVSLTDGPYIVVGEGGNRVDRTDHRDGTAPKTTSYKETQLLQVIMPRRGGALMGILVNFSTDSV